mgnify:CR=1 FL=1
MNFSKKIVFVIVAFLSFSDFCFVYAEKISHPECLYKGIIGEAVGEGYEGMYAVACVYRNRLRKGLPLGCTALKRNGLDLFCKKQGKKYKTMATIIVRKVFSENSPDVTNGATHYENIRAFGFPYWAKNMRITTVIGSHTFFVKK